MDPLRGQLFALKPSMDPNHRPVVIVSRDELNKGHSVIAIPFYSQQLERRSEQPWCARYEVGEGGLPKECVAKTDEIGMIAKSQIELASGPLGQFDIEQMDRLMDALANAIGIYDYDPNS